MDQLLAAFAKFASSDGCITEPEMVALLTRPPCAAAITAEAAREMFRMVAGPAGRVHISVFASAWAPKEPAAKQLIQPSDDAGDSRPWSPRADLPFATVTVDAELLDWSLDLREVPLQMETLLILPVRMLHAVAGVGGFGVSEIALRRFFTALRDAYLPHPFHNARHGLMVMHKAFLVSMKTSLHKYVSRLDLFALLLAAFGHDVGHPGVTNAYEVASESPLALLYNNRSVLESHHCATLSRLLQEHGIFDGLTRPQRAHVRQLIIDVIMATDMANHGPLSASMDSLHKRLPTLAARGQRKPRTEGSAQRQQDSFKKLQSSFRMSKTHEADSSECRSALLQCVLHAVDLSTPTLPFASSSGWVHALMSEFKAQVERERAAGLPLSNFLVPSDVPAVGRMESGFSGHVVSPFWKSLSQLLPELEPCCSMIDANVAAWKAVMGGASIEAVQEEHAASQRAIVEDWGALPVLLPSGSDQHFWISPEAPLELE